MTDTLTTKLGTTRAGERTRVWIEGQRLTDAGFYVGRYFHKAWGSKGTLTLLPVTAAEYETTPRALRGKVSGVKGRAVIDITGERVAETFSGTHVRVTFKPGQITIANA